MMHEARPVNIGGRALLLAFTALTAAAPARVHAQAADAKSTPFEEIVVTARKQEESLQSVPVAITAITGEQLAQKSIYRATDLQEFVPALRVISTSPALNSTYALRGLRSMGVVSYMSQIPISAAAGANALFDLASVQVLSGPQGTLFGRNSTAGTILYEPNKPRDVFEASLALRAGDYSLLGANWMINVPVSPKIAIRAAGELVSRSGYHKVVPSETVPRLAGKRRAEDDHHNSQRLSIRLTPTDTFTNDTVLFRYYSSQASHGSKLIATAACPESPTIAQLFSFAPCIYRPPLTTALGLPTWENEAAKEFALGPHETSNQFVGKTRVKALGVNNITTLEVTDDWSIVNLFGYLRTNLGTTTDPDGTNLPLVLVADNKTHNRQTTNETQLRYNASDGSVRWILGVYYGEEEQNLGVGGGLNRIFGGAPSELVIQSSSTTRQRNLGVFTQATVRVTDRLSLTGGYRHSWDTQKFRGVTFNNGFCNLVPGTPFVIDAERCLRGQVVKQDAPSYTLSADYKASDKVLLYLTTRRGYNQGGFNSVLERPTYGPETLTDFEAGVKADWNIGSIPLRTNLAVYRSSYDDIQRSVNLFVDNRPNGATINAAKARVNGMELQANARLLDAGEGGRLYLDGFVSVIDPKYSRFPYETAPGAFVDLSNNALAQAPKVTSNLSLTYTVPLPEGTAQDISFRGSWSYMSKYYYSDINDANPSLSNKADPIYRQDGYSLFNLSLDVNRIGGAPLDLQIFVKNVANKVYTIDRVNALSLLGYAAATYGAPRTWGAELRYRFD